MTFSHQSVLKPTYGNIPANIGTVDAIHFPEDVSIMQWAVEPVSHLPFSDLYEV